MRGEFSKRAASVIFERDHGRCFRCGEHVWSGERGVSWSLHHRRPRGAGGSSLPWVGFPSNGVILCGTGTTGCHGHVESHRHDARERGLLVPLNGQRKPREVVAVRWDGLAVWLTDDGRAVPVGETEF